MNPKSLENLRPSAQGEVRNPKGTNQYSYREKAVHEFAEQDELRGQSFSEYVWDLALAGKPWAARLVWDERMPAVKAVDVNLNDNRDPVAVPTTDERLSAVAALVAETLH